MPAPNGRAVTNPDLIRTAERRAVVLSLRKGGATYRQIAAAVIEWAKEQGETLPRGWDARYAYKDVQRELSVLREQMSLDTETIRTLEYERLEDLHSALWPAALGHRAALGFDGQLKAVDRVLRIAQQRARLVPDLDQAPETTGITVRVIGGVDLDEL